MVIGKSGTDWSKAPEGATHQGLIVGWIKFYDGVYCRWDASLMMWNPCMKPNNLISKQEDLNMKELTPEMFGAIGAIPSKREVRSIKDLEFGMFIQTSNETAIKIISYVGDSDFHCFYKGSTKFAHREEKDFQIINRWSWSKHGPWNEIIHETERDKKIKEIKKLISDEDYFNEDQIKILHKTIDGIMGEIK